MSENEKSVISMFLETEEGKKLNEVVKGYKKHCIEEKLAFVILMEEVPELLNRLDNVLRYHCYVDDVTAYRLSKLNEKLLRETAKKPIMYLEKKKAEQIKAKYEGKEVPTVNNMLVGKLKSKSDTEKIVMSSLYGQSGNKNK